MKEKIKILLNEVEILRNEIVFHERELAKKKQANAAAYALRDNFRNEANKYLSEYNEKRGKRVSILEHIDRHTSRIQRLNDTTSQIEQKMILLKKQYSTQVTLRNTAALQLLDINDELCVLYERLNVFRGVKKTGDEEVFQKEEVLKMMGMILNNVVRQIKKGKELLTESKENKIALEKTEKKLSEAQLKVKELSLEMGKSKR
jgi:hypothetical protein